VIHTQVDKVISKVAEALGILIPEYTPEVDPTHILKLKTEAGVVGNASDWTISTTSVSKFKKELEALKGKDKPKTTPRKRKRAKDEETSSDEEYHHRITKTKSRNPEVNAITPHVTEDASVPKVPSLPKTSCIIKTEEVLSLSIENGSGVSVSNTENVILEEKHIHPVEIESKDEIPLPQEENFEAIPSAITT